MAAPLLTVALQSAVYGVLERMKPIPSRAAVHGFSLPEVTVAMAILALVFGANMAAINFSRGQSFRNRELGIMTDFAIHYLELAKSLPFDEVASGTPINALYDGTAGAPDIRLPSSLNWQSINGANFQVFHPDLASVANRQPEMRLIMTTTTVGGAPHTKHLQLDLRWNPPLGGSKQTVSMNLVRVKDL